MSTWVKQVWCSFLEACWIAWLSPEKIQLCTRRTMQVHNEEVIDLLAPLPPLQSKALLHAPSASVQIKFSFQEANLEVPTLRE